MQAAAASGCTAGESGRIIRRDLNDCRWKAKGEGNNVAHTHLSSALQFGCVLWLFVARTRVYAAFCAGAANRVL
jgi:hypothetical protein